MADFSNVSDEELKAELERRQGAAVTSTVTNPTGILTPADFIGKIGNEWDRHGRTNNATNGFVSHKHGTRFNDNMQIAKEAGLKGNETKDQFGNELPPTAYEYINKCLEAARAKGTVSKQRLRAIQYEAQARYNLPKDFDISGKGSGNWDWAMAKQLNRMPYNSNDSVSVAVAQKPVVQKPVTSEMTGQQPNENVPSKQVGVAPEQKKPEQNINGELATNDKYNTAFKRIKNKQASDEDLAMFSQYSEEQLRKMGFGPISVQAIKGTSNKEPAAVPDAKADMFSLSYEDAKKKYRKGHGNNVYFMSKDAFEKAKAKQNAQR